MRHQCDIKATPMRVASQAVATPKPPQCDPKATLKPPQCAYKAPSWENKMFIMGKEKQKAGNVSNRMWRYTLN